MGSGLHYLDWGGEGQPTLLCLHGGRANAHVWDFAALGLRHLYRVVALDQRGHGDSGWDGARRYERDAYVSDLEGVVRELGAGPVILAAHSMGGTNSLVFAGRHPSLVRALVLVDAGPEIAPDSYERSERITSAVPDWGDYAAYVAQAQRYSRWWPPWQVHYHLRYALRELSEGVWTWKGDPATRSPERREGRDTSTTPGSYGRCGRAYGARRWSFVAPSAGFCSPPSPGRWSVGLGTAGSWRLRVRGIA